MNKEELESRLVDKIRWTWEDGSPVAGHLPAHWAELASITRRRWFSFEMRNKNKEANRANRIEDLARGLCERFVAGGLPMAGPLITDYRWLAEQLADILADESR